MATNPHPLTFRAEVVTPIMRYVAAGDSCSIVGIGSVGKSNLLRFLQRPDVRQQYLGDAGATYLFAYVDINKLLKRSRWGLLELMLHQLLIESRNQGVEDAKLQMIDDLHQRATDPGTRYLALRYLDRALGLICHQLGLRAVFLMDEFDDVCRKMNPRGFAALRALRDEYKYQLMYVVATRLELKRLREPVMEIEPFEELVSPHTIWLGPYLEEDARSMLRRLEGRHEVPLDDKTIKAVLVATGGHPGLLREAYNTAREQPANFFESLVNSPSIQDECQRIWLSLAPGEQRAMIGLAGQSELQPEQHPVVEQLRHKSLVGGPWAGDQEIFSRLLAAYVRQQAPEVDGRRVHLDRKRRIVWVNGREIRDLTPLEYKLLEYLEQSRDRVCSRDELAQHLYPDDMALEGKGVTDTRIDSVVKRLRKQIEPNPKEPRYIVTVRGHGFRWLDGGDEETGEN